jgi:hypothetical protein
MKGSSPLAHSHNEYWVAPPERAVSVCNSPAIAGQHICNWKANNVGGIAARFVISHDHTTEHQASLGSTTQDTLEERPLPRTTRLVWAMRRGSLQRGVREHQTSHSDGQMQGLNSAEARTETCRYVT